MLIRFISVAVLLVVQPRSSESKLCRPRTLSSTRLKRAAETTNYDEFASFLGPILRSRVPGTKGHHFVKEYIIKFFQDLGWSVEVDQFDQDTVIGPKHFTNIIATANPKAKTFYLLTAHYDSKIIPSNNINKDFVAATDSAVPCAMIMYIAKNLDLNTLKKNDCSLQMVFFDGEEAFQQWTEDDSIYGSRHLAKLWSEPDATGKTHLSSIEALVLLDLIGAKDGRFVSSFNTTHGLFERLQRIETRLRPMGLIQSDVRYFNGDSPVDLGIQDDHIPFLQKGVPVLHVIPYKFPDCWHQICDNGENIDRDTILDLLKILRVFVIEMMRA